MSQHQHFITLDTQQFNQWQRDMPKIRYLLLIKSPYLFYVQRWLYTGSPSQERFAMQQNENP